MDIIFITVPVTLVFIGIGIAIFFWASKGGQFDDLDGPAHRILYDDDIENTETDHTEEQDKNSKPTRNGD